MAWTETATHAAVVEHAQTGRFGLLVLDGEAAKAGGLGICRQLKAEVYECPPIVVLTGRPQDAWLAAWSEADAVIAAPFDPFEVRETDCQTLRAARAPSVASDAGRHLAGPAPAAARRARPPCRRHGLGDGPGDVG